MEMASQILPLILYMLLGVLIIVVTIFVYKLTITVDKANVVLDDVYKKIGKLDNLFEVIDKSADTINLITDKVTGVVTSSILKVFKKKRKEDDYE